MKQMGRRRPTACSKPAQGKRGTSAALGFRKYTRKAPKGRNNHREIGAELGDAFGQAAERLRYIGCGVVRREQAELFAAEGDLDGLGIGRGLRFQRRGKLLEARL